jgi:MFS family permease
MATMVRLPPGNPSPRATEVSPMRDLVDGLRYVRGRPSLGLLILTGFAVITIGFPYQSFLPSVAANVYQTGSGGLGLLQSFAAVGAVAATVLVATFAESRRAWFWQPLLALAFGASLVALGATGSLWMGLAVMVAVGGLAGGFQGLNNALTMSSTDHEYHGRVQSISMLSWSLFGLFALPIGIVADQIGIRETLMLMGAAVIGCVALLQVMSRSPRVVEDRRQALAAADLRREARMGAGGP